MSLANVALTNTFDEWRIRTNQLVTEVNDINSNVALRFISNNSVLDITSQPGRKGNVYIGLAFSTNTSDTATNNIAAASSVNTVSNLAVAAAINSNNTFNKANAANVLANYANLNATYANTLANAANTLATSTLALAITANTVANSANFTAIEALRIANLAVGNNTPALALSIAQSAFDFANTANIMAFFANNAANAAFVTANAANAASNAAFRAANSAFTTANNALPNSTVTLAGSLESTGYLNATSGLYSTAAGTPARPSISWKNDIHTGLSRPSSNTLTISTAAAGRIHIDSNGYVGIGTSTPTRLLDVTGNTNQSFTGLGSISGNVMTITSVISGQLAVGNYISDEDVSVVGGTYIKEFWTGSGGLGTYNLTATQTISSTTLYGYNLQNSSIRLTSSDASVNIGQPIGMIEFASDDADLTTDERARAFIYAVNEQANAGATLMFGTAVGAREAQERLRINRFGAIGLGGRNFGTTGQVLASNGSSNTVEWINNPGIGANAFASAVGVAANTVGIAAFQRANASLANTTSYTLVIDNLVITGNLTLSGAAAVLNLL